MTEAVLLTIDSGIARITLNRPDRLNAFNDEMAEGWAEATVAAAASDEAHAIIIDATGRAFCAGGDVRAMATMDDR
uniref:enoyl-CoA hydratase/isomerase family protein n=1 Tax=Leucobacter sp. BZR 635 TaxID=3378705 RepID=UPI003A88C94B